MIISFLFGCGIQSSTVWRWVLKSEDFTERGRHELPADAVALLCSHFVYVKGSCDIDLESAQVPAGSHGWDFPADINDRDIVAALRLFRRSGLSGAGLAGSLTDSGVLRSPASDAGAVISTPAFFRCAIL